MQRSQFYYGEIKMSFNVFFGILLPFLGTTLGSAAVFLTRKKGLCKGLCLSGFAAGVMMAASVWSLIIPAIEMSKRFGVLSFMPALLGFWCGIVFLYFSEKLLPFVTKGKSEDYFSGKLLFILAVVLHNIPEGMAVGVSFACIIEGEGIMGLGAALMLSFGMAMQNIPEGAIISVPLSDNKYSKRKAFIYGTLSGIVEPIAALVTVIFSSAVVSLLPYLLGFAAGAMIYVAVSELIPEAAGHSKRGFVGAFAFFIGFSIMMVLDVAFA